MPSARNKPEAAPDRTRLTVGAVPRLNDALTERRLMLQRQPSRILFAIGDALLDKVHPFNAVVAVGVDRIASLDRSAGGSL